MWKWKKKQKTLILGQFESPWKKKACCWSWIIEKLLSLWPSFLLLQGIEWTNIEYFNNAIICDLIENVSFPVPPLQTNLAVIFTQSCLLFVLSQIAFPVTKIQNSVNLEYAVLWDLKCILCPPRSRTKMASWRCWMKSAWGQEQSPTKHS